MLFDRLIPTSLVGSYPRPGVVPGRTGKPTAAPRVVGPIRPIVRRRSTGQGRRSMAMATRYFLTVSMDVRAEKEALFNEVYDCEHAPRLAAVPGVLSATRSVRAPLRMMLAGESRDMPAGDEPRYSVIYEIESPDVLLSPAWAEAGESGRWPTEVRPFTTNRRHVLRKVIGWNM